MVSPVNVYVYTYIHIYAYIYIYISLSLSLSLALYISMYHTASWRLWRNYLDPPKYVKQGPKASNNSLTGQYSTCFWRPGTRTLVTTIPQGSKWAESPIYSDLWGQKPQNTSPLSLRDHFSPEPSATRIAGCRGAARLLPKARRDEGWTSAYREGRHTIVGASTIPNKMVPSSELT